MRFMAIYRYRVPVVRSRVPVKRHRGSRDTHGTDTRTAQTEPPLKTNPPTDSRAPDHQGQTTPVQRHRGEPGHTGQPRTGTVDNSQTRLRACASMASCTEEYDWLGLGLGLGLGSWLLSIFPCRDQPLRTTGGLERLARGCALAQNSQERAAHFSKCSVRRL